MKKVRGERLKVRGKMEEGRWKKEDVRGKRGQNIRQEDPADLDLPVL